MLDKLNEQQIREILTQAGLDSAGQIQKIEIGFSNDVYSIADKYILKSGKSEEDEECLKREVYLCNLLKNRVPAPIVIFSDTTKQLTDRPYIIYEKIQGDNLYARWHEFSARERKELVGEICSYLKTINGTSFENYATTFNINTVQSWRDKIVSRINKDKSKVENQKLLPPEFIDQIEVFLKKNSPALQEAKMALTYYDPHFDNFIVREGRVVGMLDFERTDIMSIDYVIDIVQRMVNFPTKYASEEIEKFVKTEDYSELLDWYKEFYPELFDFKNMDVRLALYSIEHDLRELYDFPESKRARQELIKNVNKGSNIVPDSQLSSI